MRRAARMGQWGVGSIVVLLAVALLLAGSPGNARGGSGRLSVGQRARVMADYGHLALAFEPNVGQLNQRARFVARGLGYSLFLTSRGAVLSLPVTSGAPSRAAESTRPGSGAAAPTSVGVSLSLAGVSRRVRLSALGRLPGSVNYLLGRDRARWRTGVSTFSRVQYQGVWPGIGAVFYGHQGRLEYDFDVAPGADPTRIGLSFGGATQVRIGQSGALVLSTRAGTLRELAPVAYQVIDGRRVRVPSRYRLGHTGVARVLVGAYDHARPLVIDPALVYSTYLGGSIDDQGEAIAVAANGDAYITGTTESTDFPTTPTTGSYQASNGGSYDAFVTMLAANGSNLVYSTYLGGSGYDQGTGIAVDSSGDAYVTGNAGSSDFPVTSGADQTTYGGSQDAFVTKLSPGGSSLLYSTYLGGSGYEQAGGIAVDASGDAYITGATSSTDFPVSAGAFQTADAGSQDAFVTKLSPGGSSLEYSSYFGGSGIDVANAIAVGSSGDAYITGETYSADLPTTSGAFQTTYTDEEAFVTRLSADGGSLAYSTYLGSSSQGFGIAVDSSGDAYITGNTYSGSFPVTPGTYQTTYGGDFDAFVTKLSADGGSLVYSSYLGGSSGEEGYGIALDSSGEAWITGSTSSGDFPVTFDASQPSLGGKDDAFVTQVSADGSSLLYSTYLGGSSYEEGKGIGVDSSGDAYIAGATESTDFPVTAGAYQTTDGNTAYSGFVAGFGPGIATLTGLASSVNPSTVNQPVLYTATVTDKRAPARGARPIPGGGRVAFSDDGTTISGCGAVAVNTTTGVANCQVSYASPASHVIQAIYSGYSTYASSSSNTLNQIVNAAATTPSTATSTSAATSTPTSTTGSGAAPVLIHAPVITGTAKPKHTLSCSTGSWSGSPTSYDYAWSRGGVLLAGETHASLSVVSLDEGSALTCRVTAINSAGSATAASAAVKVAVPKVAGCPAATGSLSGTKLGLITLGMTKARAHEVFRKHSDRGTRYEDFFCLTPIGVRVGYPSATLLKGLTKTLRRSLTGRVIWASTSNPFYALDGVRAGESVLTAAKVLKTTLPFHIGLNDWYLARKPRFTAVLKVRKGVVQEIGIATNALTKNRRAQNTLMHSFS